MKRIFKGLWYMIWDIVGVILTTCIMLPIYMLSCISIDLVISANIIMWDLCKRSIYSMIVDIICTVVAIIMEIIVHVAKFLISIIMCIIIAAMNASIYSRCKDGKYEYAWRYEWNELQAMHLKATSAMKERKYSAFSFKSYSDK